MTMRNRKAADREGLRWNRGNSRYRGNRGGGALLPFKVSISRVYL